MDVSENHQRKKQKLKIYSQLTTWSQVEMTMTNIYHIVHFSYDDSIHVYFKGCNFQCKGCVCKISPWDIHLPPDVCNRLPSIEDVDTLSLPDLDNLLRFQNAGRAILSGGDPTVDDELPSVVKFFTDSGMGTILFTNGDLLNEGLIHKLEEAGLGGVYVSVKAYSNPIHKQFTGNSNKRSLENFKRLVNSRIKLRAGTILIPGLVDVDEIERLAKFIGGIDPNIPFRIAGYLPVAGTPWRGPTKDESVRAAQVAGKYLKNVYYTHSGMSILGEFRVLYPEL